MLNNISKYIFMIFVKLVSGLAWARTKKMWFNITECNYKRQKRKRINSGEMLCLDMKELLVLFLRYIHIRSVRLFGGGSGNLLLKNALSRKMYPLKSFALFYSFIPLYLLFYFSLSLFHSFELSWLLFSLHSPQTVFFRFYVESQKRLLFDCVMRSYSDILYYRFYLNAVHCYWIAGFHILYNCIFSGIFAAYINAS